MHTLSNLLSPATFTCFVIPVCVVVLSWIFQSGFSMKLNAGGDIFAFSLGLDLNLLAQQPKLVSHINIHFQYHYAEIFVMALLVSIAFLYYSTKTQSLISKRRPRKYYPLAKVLLCWSACIATMGFHLYALLWS
jgi:hypothetical protein